MNDLGINRQVVIEKEGNTKLPSQSSRKTFYCFTAYPKFEKDESLLIDALKGISNKFMFGREICPTTGKKHLQGFIHLKKMMRITEIKLPMKPHLEACKGSEEQNTKYCSKDGDYFKFGFPKPIKTIELRPWQQKILDITLEEPDDRTINWYWESVGGIGKSAFCKYMVIKHQATFCSSGKYADLINVIYNTDMDKCNVIIFDIPRNHKNNISYSALESIKNGLICNTKYETGAKAFNSPHVIVFCNEPPDESQMSKDRWKITELTPE